MTKGMRNTRRNGRMLLVSITNDHTLKSRMMGNYHVRFGSGSGGSNPSADHKKTWHNRHHHLLHPAKNEGRNPGGGMNTVAQFIKPVQQERADFRKVSLNNPP